MESYLGSLVINFLRIFFLITSPVTLLVGIFLLYDVNMYQRVERFLARSYNSSNVMINALEKNRETFQVFMLRNRYIVGIICLFNAVISIIISYSVFSRKVIEQVAANF